MLDMSDVDRVTWLCQQLDPAQLLSQEPLPLSQSILLSLMQQLGSQLGKASIHLEAANMMHSAHCSTALLGTQMAVGPGLTASGYESSIM